MPVLSILTIQGDPDELAAKLEEHVQPVAERKAREYGGITSTVCRTDDGIMVVNLWENEEGRHKMADDPELQNSLRSAGFPPPQAKGYEVITHRTVGES